MTESAPNHFAVIITSYGKGPFLERAIQSVLNQTLQGFELVIVDDDSPDDETLAVLEAWSSRVCIIRLTQNQGVSVARNIGISETTAPLLLCLDGDDHIEPSYLEKACELFAQNSDVGIVGCWTHANPDESDSSRSRPTAPSLPDLLSINSLPSASCFRRDSVVGRKHFDEHLRGYEDWDHWIRIMCGGWRCLIIEEFLFFYQRSNHSKVNTSNRNAGQLMTRIIRNNSNAYLAHFEEILIAKHARVLKVEAEKSDLQSRLREARPIWRRVLKRLFTILSKTTRRLRVMKY